jgi:NAD(P)-dependent dehydrogenase (short-subunit alcohol dehydrogenase family)
LIIGGSRGLGELTAKILASGGGDTIITYAQGRGDAEAVCTAINAGSTTRCSVRKFDLLTDSIESLGIDLNQLDGIYFFATPRIFRKKRAFFDQQLLDEFLESYVYRFYDLCLFLESRLKRKVRIYFPSSVFVESRPRDFTEYAMAKAAAEVLISDINRTFKNVTVLTGRLPRLNTDQTTSVLKVETESNIGAMLPVVRSMLDTGATIEGRLPD